jgi:hypothetical protein
MDAKINGATEDPESSAVDPNTMMIRNAMLGMARTWLQRDRCQDAPHWSLIASVKSQELPNELDW